MEATPALRIIGYVRVSTDKQDIGPEVQIAELEAEAARMSWDLTIVREDAVSASTVAKRPLMLQALADLKAGRYDGLAVSKLDRLSRNMEDGTRILGDSTRQGWRIVCLDLGVDTATIMGAGMFNMALNFAEIERRMIGKRTKDAMAKIKADTGKHMGRRSALPQSTVARIVADHRAGVPMLRIARNLEAEDIPTAAGGKWYAATIKQVLSSAAAQQLEAVAPKSSVN
jgi:DNA invertase Pin-like site-specific DNA recombinase